MRFIFVFLNILLASCAQKFNHIVITKCVNILDKDLDFHLDHNHVLANYSTSNEINNIIGENTTNSSINNNVYNNKSNEISVVNNEEFLFPTNEHQSPDVNISLSLDHKSNSNIKISSDNTKNLNKISKNKSTYVNNYIIFGMRIKTTSKPYFMSTSESSESSQFNHQNHSHEINLGYSNYEKLKKHESKKSDQQLSDKLDSYNHSKILNETFSQTFYLHESNIYNDSNNLHLYKHNINKNIHYYNDGDGDGGDDDNDFQVKNSTKDPYLYIFSDSTPQVYHISHANGVQNIKLNINNSTLNIPKTTSNLSLNRSKNYNKDISKSVNQKEMNIRKLRINDRKEYLNKSRFQDNRQFFNKFNNDRNKTKSSILPSSLLPQLLTLIDKQVSFEEKLDVLHNLSNARTNAHIDHENLKASCKNCWKPFSREFVIKRITEKVTNQPLKKKEYNDDNNNGYEQRKIRKIFKKNLQDNEENESSNYFSYEWRNYPFKVIRN